MEKSKFKKEFQAIERKLHLLLKNSKVELFDSDDETQVKQNIKKHIENLNEIRLLFDEYERLAKLIFADSDDSGENAELKKNETKPQKNSKDDNHIKIENKKPKKQKNIAKQQNLLSEFSKNI